MAYLTKPTSPLSIATFDGSGQAVHPTIVDFLTEHGMASWAGYRYWLAITPYPAYDDRYENPCLYGSHDGYAWEVPSGITNPLTLGKVGYGPNGEPDTHDATGAFNADPCLVYQPELNELWVYFASGKTGFSVFKVPETLAVPEPVGVGHGNMSVAVLRDPYTGDLHYWDLYPGPPFPSDGWHFKIRHRKWLASTQTWSSAAAFCNDVCQDTMDGWDGIAQWKPWHIDAKWNPRRGKVEILIAVQQDPGGTSALALVETTLDSPTVLVNPLSQFLLARAPGTGTLWDSSLLYKATQVIGADGFRRVWYSAAGGSTGQEWHIGYTEGVLPLDDTIYYLDLVSNVTDAYYLDLVSAVVDAYHLDLVSNVQERHRRRQRIALGGV